MDNTDSDAHENGSQAEIPSAAAQEQFQLEQEQFQLEQEQFQLEQEPLQDEPFRERIVSDLLKRIINDDFLRMIRNSAYDPDAVSYYRKLGSYLSKGSAEFEKQLLLKRSTSLNSYSERTKDVLKQIGPRYVTKYKILLQRLDAWKPNRKVLIEKLANHINYLDKNSKISTVVRLIASSIDVSGSVGGLILRSESDWATLAMKTGSFCGLCGLVSTVAEVQSTKKILEDVSQSIERDLKLLKPILEWFGRETADLDALVEDLFPHGIDSEIVQIIQEASAEQDYYLKVFRAALVSNVRRDINLIENRDFLHSLQLFAQSDLAPLWWNRMLYQRDPILLDFSRMALQMEFGQTQSIIYQCIPALPLEQQRLSSLPVAGRIMLNFLTMYDSITNLMNGAKSKYSDKLRRELDRIKSEFELIDNLVQKMNPEEELT